MKHTPEPWDLIKHGNTEFFGGRSKGHSNWFLFENALEKNARRIVACVNACADMEDPAAELAALRQQRDELLEALERAELNFRTHRTGGYRLDYKGSPAHEEGSTYEAIIKAIAKAKGGKP